MAVRRKKHRRHKSKSLTNWWETKIDKTSVHSQNIERSLSKGNDCEACYLKEKDESKKNGKVTADEEAQRTDEKTKRVKPVYIEVKVKGQLF